MTVKSLTGLTILIFAFQILVDCLNTVTVFPFLHYGMFSGKFEKKDIETFEIIVNNKPLTAQKFGILEWDLINSPLITFKKQLTTSDFTLDKTVIKRNMASLGMEAFFKAIEPNLNNDPEFIKKFPSWYSRYLEKFVDSAVDKLEVNIVYHSYNHGEYMLLKKIKWIEL